METSAEETLVTKKVNGAVLSPGLASYFFWMASQRRALAVAGAGVTGCGCNWGKTCERDGSAKAAIRAKTVNERGLIRRRKITAECRKESGFFQRFSRTKRM